MKPQEIRDLLQQAPELGKAFKAEPVRMWRFLRDEVDSGYAVTICIKCRREGILLETPYRPDLCISCLLTLLEQLKDDPIIDKYRDKRSRFYDLVYDAHCASWEGLYTLPDDYDRPPIAIG